MAHDFPLLLVSDHVFRRGAPMIDERLLIPDLEGIPEDDEAEPDDAGVDHNQPDPK